MRSVDRGKDARQEPELDQLMVAAAGGDEEAFAGVYDTVARPVTGLVRKVLRDQAQSEEIVQEVLVEVWRTAKHFRPDRDRAMTWIMTLAHRRAVSRMRASHTAENRVLTRAELSSQTLFNEMSERVQTHAEWQRIRLCVDGLTDIQYEALVLAYYGGFTYKEIAHALSLPLSTVKGRLRDAMIRLRDCMMAKT